MKTKAIVLTKKKLIYIEIPKAASGSIKDALASIEKIKLKSKKHLEWRKGRIPEIDLSKNKYKKFYKFTFVRNPFTRIVSAYYSIVLTSDREYSPRLQSLFGSRIQKAQERLKPIRQKIGKKHISFQDFIFYLKDTSDSKLNVHWRPQYTFLSKKFFLKRKIYPDFIGKVENIKKDWINICKHIGVNIKLPHQGKVFHPRYYECYNPQTWKIVKKRYKKDLKIFNYRKEVEKIEKMIF